MIGLTFSAVYWGRVTISALLRILSGICVGAGVGVGVAVGVTVGCSVAEVEETSTGVVVGSGMTISVNEKTKLVNDFDISYLQEWWVIQLNVDWAYSIAWCIATTFLLIEITASWCSTSAGVVDHFCPRWT